jgi:hypothetical protein
MGGRGACLPLLFCQFLRKIYAHSSSQILLKSNAHPVLLDPVPLPAGCDLTAAEPRNGQVTLSSSHRPG